MKRSKNIIEAAAAIADNGIIAYPTEGVFGLGCNPDNTDVVARLIQLKERESDKGLILIAANREQLSPYIDKISADIESQLQQSWPGPVTWILPAATNTSALLTGGRNTIAARVTAFTTAADLCRACGHALISTSANISGEESFVRSEDVAAQFPQLDYIVDLPVGSLQGPTPIFDGVSGKQLR